MDAVSPEGRTGVIVEIAPQALRVLVAWDDSDEEEWVDVELLKYERAAVNVPVREIGS